MIKFYFFITLLIYYSICYISIPFKRKFEDEINYDNIFNILLNNNLETNIELGTPPQEITVSLNFRDYAIFIKNTSFNKITSDSFKNVEDPYDDYNDYFDEEIENPYKKKKEAELSNDVLFLDNKKVKIENINFLIYNKSIEKANGFIGFNLYPNSDIQKFSNLIEQLKVNKIIDSYYFFIKYTNDNEGNLILGNTPHEIYKNNYLLNNFYFKHLKRHYESDSYHFSSNFDKIIFENDTKDLCNVEFCLENGMIKTSNSFSKILEKYFTKYINENICFKIEKNSNFFYYCKKNIAKNFPSLIFQINQTKTKFELTGKDLFYKFNDNYYLLLYYDKQYNNNWILGKPFLKKYLIVFNQDQVTFGYYSQFKNNNKNYLFSLSFLIHIFSFIIILGLLSYIFIFLKKKLKKNRANELDENYEYISENNQQFIQLNSKINKNF